MSDALTVIPSLDLTLKILAFSVTFLYGESFYNLDGEMQETDWFKKLNRIQQYLLKCFMDVNHHFQYGLVLIILGWLVPTNGLVVLNFTMSQSIAQTLLWWGGAGFVSSDFKDFENILKRLGLRKPLRVTI